MPGSGFAQTFMGMDVIIVRYLAWKAKRLARKWGGQCIVFIDEIDAVGMRRAALDEGGMGGFTDADPATFEDFASTVRNGSLTPTGDLVLETRAWREQLFADACRSGAGRIRPGQAQSSTRRSPGMMGGQGQLALNQLLVVMDGIGNPPFSETFFTNRINTFLDATYIVPRRVAASLRMPPAAAAERADLLHRRDERAARGARPGAHAAGADGSLRLAPHADQAGSARHLRPLPQQGLARP